MGGWEYRGRWETGSEVLLRAKVLCCAGVRPGMRSWRSMLKVAATRRQQSWCCRAPIVGFASARPSFVGVAHLTRGGRCMLFKRKSKKQTQKESREQNRASKSMDLFKSEITKVQTKVPRDSTLECRRKKLESGIAPLVPRGFDPACWGLIQLPPSL